MSAIAWLGRGWRWGCLVAVVVLVHGTLPAAEEADYWAGYNQDGHRRKSSERSLAGNLQIRWTKVLRGYEPDNTSDGRGYRSYNLSVREGKILVAHPVAGIRPKLAYSLHSLRTGELLSVVLTSSYAHFLTGSGNDVDYGLSPQYWQRDGSVFGAYGGDGSSCWHFNPYNGQILVPGGIVGGFNASSRFVMGDREPGQYQPFANGGTPGDGWSSASSMGMLDPEGNRVAGIQAGGTTRNGGTIGALVDGMNCYLMTAGTNNADAIDAYALSTNPVAQTRMWNYNFPTGECFYSWPMCLGGDGRIYAVVYGANGLKTNGQDMADSILRGIRRSDGVCDRAQVLLSDDWVYDTRSVHMASRTNYVAVLSGYRNVIHKLHCYDTEAQALAWPGYTFATNAFMPLDGGGWLAQEKMAIAGDAIYVVQTRVQDVTSNLTLVVDRFALADGAHTNMQFTLLDENANPLPVSGLYTTNNMRYLYSVREVAAVDGTLACLLDYDYANQVLVVIEGDATPALNLKPSAVISRPVTGRTYMDTGTLKIGDVFSDQPLPYDRFDTGVPVAFSSTGSLAMNGGPLAYAWNFGDGTTSTDAAPVHVYASAGHAPQVTNRTVTLTVTDTNGNASVPARLGIRTRDVGAVVATQLTAMADTYAYDASAHGVETQIVVRGTAPVKTGYLRFNVAGITLTNVVSARLRLYCPSGVGVSGSNNFLRAWACSTNWSESTLVSNNAPARTQMVGALRLNPAAYMGPSCYLDIPVTTYVKTWTGGSLLACALDSIPSGSGVTFSSREGVEPPQLLLQTGAPGYAPPVITNQPQDALAGTSGSALTIGATSAAVGESNLVYCWRMVTSSVASANVLFVPNHTNSAKATTAYLSTNIPGSVLTCVCEVWDGLQTTTSRVATLYASQTPVPSFTLTPFVKLAPVDVQFDAGASYDPDGSIVAYDWDFGDGSTGSGAAVTHTYNPTTGGVFTVTLAVTDNMGASASLSRYVTVLTAAGGPNAVELQEGVLGYTGCRDTYVRNDLPANNYGASASCVWGMDPSSNPRRPLVAFDLPSYIPAVATVSSASLGLYATNIGFINNVTATVYEVSRPWAEGTSKSPADGATWNEAAPGVAWTTPGGDYGGSGLKFLFSPTTASNVWVTLEVGSAVSNWVSGIDTNNGLILTTVQRSNSMTFQGKEGTDPALRPKLAIRFTLPVVSNFLPVACGLDQSAGISPRGSGGAFVMLDGRTSFDMDGTIVSYQWRENGALIATGATPSVFFAAQGRTNVHMVALTVTDDAGATNTDPSVLVTIIDQAPTVNAGPDQTLVLPAVLGLSGTVADGDGLAPCAWSKVSGPAATILSPSNAATIITGLTAGDYVFRLTVTDEAGVTVSDDMVAHVADTGSAIVRACGYNSAGEVGDGTVTKRTSPVNASGICAVRLAAGYEHSLAVRSDGTVYGWGSAQWGQVGDGTTSNRSSPVVISNLVGMTAVSCGRYSSLAMGSNGTVWAWGYNGAGQLGIGTSDSSAHSTPVQVPGISSATAIQAGGWHSLAVLSDGTVKAWGSNDRGQLGDGSASTRLSPVSVTVLSGVKAVAAGDGFLAHSLALRSDGTVWAWGGNDYGQLGIGTNDSADHSTPVQIAGLSNVTAIAAGSSHSLAVLSNGTVWVWGLNDQGQLGDGTQSNRVSPVQVNGLSNMVAVSGGNLHSLALKADGSVYSWGENFGGKLGDGTETRRLTPVLAINLTGGVVSNIAAGGTHSIFGLVQTVPAGALRFGTSSFTAGEGDGMATVTVARVSGSKGAVGVTFSATNGTAIAGSDFAATNGTLSWAAGDTAVKTFAVRLLDDAVIESNETISLVLSSATGGATLGTPGTAVLTLLDNDAPPAPVITSAAAATGQVGVAFLYLITAANNPTNYTAAGLPGGLTLNTTNGVISGTPEVAGTFAVSLGAANAGGAGLATLTLVVNPPSPHIAGLFLGSGGEVSLHWDAIPVTQIVERCYDLVVGPWTPVFTAAPSITGPYIETATNPACFYRIIVPQD